MWSRLLIIFSIAFFVYFAVATKLTFHPLWTIDYFNIFAQSLRAGRFDLVNPPQTYDLVSFDGRWYLPLGPLPALFLIPLQIFKGHYIPPIYLSIVFASFSISMAYLLLTRIKQEFFPEFSFVGILLVTALFAFGTTQFYVGTLGSYWHVDQIVSSFFGNLAFYVIFKKKRKPRDYLLSAVFCGVTLLGRGTLALMSIVPGMFFFHDYVLTRLSRNNYGVVVKHAFIWFGVPAIVFSVLFFSYNLLRFGSPFEYGYSYIHEAPYLAHIREEKGIISMLNLPTNLWYLLAEIPKITYRNGVFMDFDLRGNSIFFLTPPFLAIFLASPVMWKRKRLVMDIYVAALWFASVGIMIPSLLIYSTGWMQFGYRYSLDVTLLLVVLSIFGMKGKLNFLYVLGIGFSILMYSLGIRALQ